MKTLPVVLESLSKKRKWEGEEAGETLEKPLGDKSTKSISFVELHLETDPLPPEWQRCLDVESGEMHFYNTRTQKRTSMDPRTSPERIDSDSSNMSLDLELNLPCGSVKKNQIADHGSFTKHEATRDLFANLERYKKSSGGHTRSPSWLTTEGDQQEMVTAVCMQCHMLVLLCKSCPSCPNCKFMHPPGQNPPNLFNRRFKLFC